MRERQLFQSETNEEESLVSFFPFKVARNRDLFGAL